MKKTRKLIITLIISTILLLSFVIAQSTNPWSASAAGIEKNIFKTTDSVYLKSGKLCEPADEVDVYIVEDSDNWTDGDALDDVRGAPEPVALINSAIPLTQIWESPDGGKYDIVVDCNKNGQYDEFVDKIDSFSGPGFEVEAVAGGAKAERGSNDMGDHKWQYDPEEPDFVNEMLQLSLTASGEDVELINMTISALGSGDDTEISALEVYVDEDSDGKLGDNETLIGDSQPAYEDDNGETTIDLDYFLTKNVKENIIIVYRMKENASKGEFSFRVDSITGMGGDSGNIIKFSGLPIESGEKTVISEKTCLGEVSIVLSPNPAKTGESVKAAISGLEGCGGREASLRSNPCGSSTPKVVGSCILKEDSCNISFKASSSLTYYICVDKNDDNDSVDFGEYAYEDLAIESPAGNVTSVEENETETEENETAEEEETEEEVKNTTGGITGGITGIGAEITETNSFFILLEVTLLLILFVLVMILFRLRPAAVEPQKEEEKEEHKPEKSEKNGKEKKK